MSATILVVDDHAMLRHGVRGLLERKGFRVVGEAADGRQAATAARELSPDVVIMDITMPDLDGIAATREILASLPECKVIALSIHGGKRFVENMLQAGAVGYVLKDSVPEELVTAVHAVLKGESYLSPAITGLVVAQYVNLLTRTAPGDGSGAVTEAEEHYVRLVGEGYGRDEIAVKLSLDSATLRELELAVLEKLQLSGLPELVEYAGTQKWHSARDGRDGAEQQTQDTREDRARLPVSVSLTNRELDVLALLDRRFSDKEIARELSVGVPTVKTHVSHILQKLGAANRRDAVSQARARGLTAGALRPMPGDCT